MTHKFCKVALAFLSIQFTLSGQQALAFDDLDDTNILGENVLKPGEKVNVDGFIISCQGSEYYPYIVTEVSTQQWNCGYRKDSKGTSVMEEVRAHAVSKAKEAAANHKRFDCSEVTIRESERESSVSGLITCQVVATLKCR